MPGVDTAYIKIWMPTFQQLVDHAHKYVLDIDIKTPLTYRCNYGNQTGGIKITGKAPGT